MNVRNTRWSVVVLAVAAGMIAAAFVGKAPPALPAMRAELGLGLVAAGWVVSIFSAMGMVGGMVAGLFADFFGHRRLLVAGLAAMVAGGVLGSAADGETVMLASRFIEGLGFVAIAVSAPSLIARASATRHLRLSLGFWSIYMPAGSSLTMVLSPLVLGPFGWRGLWLMVAAAAALLAIAVAVTGGESRSARNPSAPWRGIGLTVSRAGPWLLAACFTAYTLQWISLMVWLPSFLMAERASTVLAAASLTALVVAFNVPGNLLAGWLLHRNVPRWLLIAVASVVMGACSLGIFSDAVADFLRYGLCLLFSAAGGMLPAAVLAGAPVHAPGPEYLGITNGLLVQGSNTGQFLGPPVVAALVAASGAWQSASWFLVVCAGVGVVLALALRAIERRAVATPG
jgi:MFS family permease